MKGTTRSEVTISIYEGSELKKVIRGIKVPNITNMTDRTKSYNVQEVVYNDYLKQQDKKAEPQP